MSGSIALGGQKDYTLLSLGDVDHDEPFAGRRNSISTRKRKRSVMLGTGVILILFTLAVGGLFVVTAPRRHHIVTTRSCGSTPAEARASGCVFDVMSFAWHQPACFDQELTSDFMEESDWQWFADEDATVGLPQMEVVAGEHPVVFVARQYKFVHCTFMWRKLHRAMLNKSPIDGYIGDYGQTKHCGQMLLKTDQEETANVTNTIASTKYPTCGYANI